MIIFGMNETEIKEELSRMSAIELRENADELDRTVIAYLDLTSAMRKRADKLDQEKLNYLAGL